MPHSNGPPQSGTRMSKVKIYTGDGTTIGHRGLGTMHSAGPPISVTSISIGVDDVVLGAS